MQNKRRKNVAKINQCDYCATFVAKKKQTAAKVKNKNAP